MYWVVFSCCLLVESWMSFILMWYDSPFCRSAHRHLLTVPRIPFYGYFRLLFLLYLILPQTQGARIIYEESIHPLLEENESQIDEFISSAHDRLKAAGAAYFKQAIEFLRTNLFGLPPSRNPPPAPETTGPQSYTQSLLARFSVPTTRWTTPTNAGADFYNMLAGAVSAATAAAGSSGAARAAGDSGILPSNLQASGEKMTFIAAQRERLNILLSALDNEAKELERADTPEAQTPTQHTNPRKSSLNIDSGDEAEEGTQRPPSGLSMWNGLSKSRSEIDFVKVEVDNGIKVENDLRKRNISGSSTGSWMPWNWVGSGDAEPETEVDQ